MIHSRNIVVSFPLPIFSTEVLGTQTGKTGEEFELHAGLSKELIRQLIEKSTDSSDSEIQNNTSDPQRFGHGSYEDWYSKQRTPFTLVHTTTGALAGLVWFGPKPLGRKSLKHLSDIERQQDEKKLDAGEWHTIVYRSYPPFRGTGLMKEFVRFCIEEYKKVYPGTRLWAGIHSENPASVGFASALGFVVDAEHSHPAEHHSVMILL